MPKSKKRKTNHQHHSTNNNGDLTHEEIWDDSALIRSWNDAVTEYEFYHSIHAKGEDVDDVLRKYEEEQQGREQDQDDPLPINSTKDVDVEDGEIEDEPEQTSPSQIINFEKPNQNKATTNSTEPTTKLPDLQPNKGPSEKTTTQPNPSTSTPSQTLENIKMAYYWAGYYSGLYDGQNLTQVQTQPGSQK